VPDVGPKQCRYNRPTACGRGLAADEMCRCGAPRELVCECPVQQPTGAVATHRSSWRARYTEERLPTRQNSSGERHRDRSLWRPSPAAKSPFITCFLPQQISSPLHHWVLGVDVMVRQTDAGSQLPYLPQATEEDHAADPLKNGPRLQ